MTLIITYHDIVSAHGLQINVQEPMMKAVSIMPKRTINIVTGRIEMLIPKFGAHRR
jgi:hypothetical protein